MSAQNQNARYALVVADFYADIAEALAEGARRALLDAGVDAKNISCVHVPGAFEIPHACARLIDETCCDAIIALGAVVRGETPHFDYVAGECARALMDLNLLKRAPVIFGVLTTDTMQQARARAGAGDKGGDAARAAMRMARLRIE